MAKYVPEGAGSICETLAGSGVNCGPDRTSGEPEDLFAQAVTISASGSQISRKTVLLGLLFLHELLLGDGMGLLLLAGVFFGDEAFVGAVSAFLGKGGLDVVEADRLDAYGDAQEPDGSEEPHAGRE